MSSRITSFAYCHRIVYSGEEGTHLNQVSRLEVWGRTPSLMSINRIFALIAVHLYMRIYIYIYKDTHTTQYTPIPYDDDSSLLCYSGAHALSLIINTTRTRGRSCPALVRRARRTRLPHEIPAYDWLQHDTYVYCGKVLG